jgi:hypothetical protein
LSDAQQTNRGKNRQHYPNGRPTSCSSWWFVVAGVCQIYFASRFATFYEGAQGNLRKLCGGVAMEPLYAAIGILAFVVAGNAPVLLAIASYV